MEALRPSSRKGYLVILCLIAITILVVGAALRPATIAAPVRTASEFLQLQLQAKKRDLERTALYFQTRASALVTRSQDARARPDQAAYARPRTGDAIVLVTADGTGQAVWASAAVAGISEMSCDGRSIEEIESTVTIPRILTNATAFNLENSVAGFVVTCGERRVLTTAGGFKIASEPTFAQKLQACCGLQVSGGANGGLEILQMTASSRMAASGARVGDTIVAIGGQPVEAMEQLEALFQQNEVALSVQRKRSRGLLKLTVPAIDIGSGIRAR